MTVSFPETDAPIRLKQAMLTASTPELNSWLINAFNGEWLKVDKPVPIDAKRKRWQAEIEDIKSVVERRVPAA